MLIRAFPGQVIAAEGEHKASRALRHAAEVICESPAALQVYCIDHFMYAVSVVFLYENYRDESTANKYFQKGNCAASFPISTFMYL
jgi:hypothetical protein